MTDLAAEAHGMARENKGRLEGVDGAIQNGKKQRGELYGRMNAIEQNVVKKADCEKLHEGLKQTIPDLVKQAVSEAMNGRKRSRWLVTKDILIITLAPLVSAAIGYFFWRLSQGAFTP